MTDWIEIKPLDLVSAFAGGLVGFGLVHLVNWLWKPRVKVLGFEKTPFNLGPLYKFRFKLKGRNSPGFCCLQIQWCCKSVYAKWDETPNPVEHDNANHFRPELVSATYFLPLFLHREYAVPIVIERNGNREIFSGWWFGKDKGYGPDPKIELNAIIRLTLSGGNFTWSKEYSVNEICFQS